MGSRQVVPAHPEFVRSKIIRNGNFVWLHRKAN
jgi:hypothetical protein